MIRVVINKEGDIFDGTGKQQGRGAYVSKDVQSVEAPKKKAYLKDILMQILRS